MYANLFRIAFLMPDSTIVSEDLGSDGRTQLHWRSLRERAHRLAQKAVDGDYAFEAAPLSYYDTNYDILVPWLALAVGPCASVGPAGGLAQTGGFEISVDGVREIASMRRGTIEGRATGLSLAWLSTSSVGAAQGRDVGILAVRTMADVFSTASLRTSQPGVRLRTGFEIGVLGEAPEADHGWTAALMSGATYSVVVGGEGNPLLQASARFETWSEDYHDKQTLGDATYLGAYFLTSQVSPEWLERLLAIAVGVGYYAVKGRDSSIFWGQPPSSRAILLGVSIGGYRH